MNISVEQLPALRVAAVRHVGPYESISQAFAELDQIVRTSDLRRLGDHLLLAIYHDDPETTRPEDLRSDAGMTVPRNVKLPATLVEAHIAAGRYARIEHVGPYEELGKTWARFKHEWMPDAGLRAGSGPSFEVYRNTPMSVRPNQLITHLYMSVA